MEIPVIQTSNLSFSFNSSGKALDNINLVVPQGSIFGFLGPNGAGKTTTLRLLLGLLRKQQGTIEIFGKELNDNRIPILKRIGSLIEQPSLYLHLTATENLEIYRRVYGCPKDRIRAVLNIVGLENTGTKKARQFSLGMKQRLSIAVALLHQPELLILDEPVNGLDPSGIIEARELIRMLNKEHNTTVLVSSHILNEVERMATHVGIIHKGVMLFQGTLSDLHHLKKEQTYLEIETSDNAKASVLLQELFPVQQKTGKILLPAQSQEKTASINRMLLQEDIDVYSLHQQQNDLEQLFIDITSNHK